MTLICPNCKVETKTIEKPPDWFPTATHKCKQCYGFLDGTIFQGELTLGWGKTCWHWPGYIENIDKNRDKALEILNKGKNDE